MASGTTGTGFDERLAGSKLQPLDSATKTGVQLDASARGATGSDRTIDQARINPLGGRGQFQHPASHADSQGVVGRDGVLSGSKLAPLDSGSKPSETRFPGLDDETVDHSRVPPLGEVREEIL